MMPPVFIDAGYILALVNTADEHHHREPRQRGRSSRRFSLPKQC